MRSCRPGRRSDELGRTRYACARLAREGGSETRTFKTMFGSLRVMWNHWSRRLDCGDGVDLDVLEAAVLLPRGGDGMAAQPRT